MDGWICPWCHRSFTTKTGLGVHKQKAHPVEYNEEVIVPNKKQRWSDEEVRILALDEAKAPQDAGAINQYLLRLRKGSRTLEAIKGIRKRQDYKDLVQTFKNDILNRVMQSTANLCPDGLADQVNSSASGLASRPVRMDTASDWLREKLEDIVPEMAGGIWIRAAIARVMDGQSPEEFLDQWWCCMFPDLNQAQSSRLVRNPIPWTALPKRVARRRDYRRLQNLWRRNMSKAAHKVLDGDAADRPHPSLLEQVDFWRPTFEATATRTGNKPEVRVGTGCDLDSLWSPITVGEVINIKLPISSAPGLDGMTVKRWMTEVPALLRACVFNIIMAMGRVPSGLLESRTVLIPKTGDLTDPVNYRPISVASVVLRHFHKILANRLLHTDPFDRRQRAFIAADGCAENIAVLSTLLTDARAKLSEIHILSLDVRKAFDTISHQGIYEVLEDNGFPVDMIQYIRSLYELSTLRIEVDGTFSDGIHPGRGVRQGDPLSPLIFNLVMDVILASVPEQVGYVLAGSRVNALAFADDLLIIGSTEEGTQRSLDAVLAALGYYGLELAPNKCSAFSLVPVGKIKKMKILTESIFKVGNRAIPQQGVLDTIRYLGVRFDRDGLVKNKIEIMPYLERITQAPLKPQQRMMILRNYLTPRFIHPLVLGRTSMACLKKIDKQIRAAIRRWLRLPQDVSMAFFHSPIGSGGLGVMSFEASIPRLVHGRLTRLNQSAFSLAKLAGNSDWASRKKRWSAMAMRRCKNWPAVLHASVDGFELREAGKVTASTNWLRDPMVHIPPSDWLSYIKVWVNALPSRIRTTRGLRRGREDVLCRAGCGVQETTAHIIQQCFRTHGGRVLRHDMVASVLASELNRGGYELRREHLFRTSEGARKPDIIAKKGDQAFVIDAQVVSGARPLAENHEKKSGYYANNKELLEQISSMFQVSLPRVQVTTATLTWRGIWSKKSEMSLRGLGLSMAVLRGITTRVLRGSYLNFVRFNQMTTMYHGRQCMRMSGWGPP